MSPDQSSSTENANAEITSEGPAAPVRKILPRGLTIAALSVLGVWVAVQGRLLWREWQTLRQELEQASNTTIVGYPNIHPKVSLAIMPANWYRSEGEAILLWAGWDEGVGHHWFRLNQGELDRSAISAPLGRDVIPAIDNPWVEIGDGQVWQRIPSGAPVVGQTLEGLPCVYPLKVLSKVVVVNDLVNNHPYLVLYSPGRPPEKAVSIFDSRVVGGRLTLGTTGYFLNGQPVLYDRATESLWVERDETFAAISGMQKGNRLPLVARPMPIAWSDWKSRNPGSRLVIGAKDQGVE
jgi:Protein of unknown function (DUF3179)